MTSSTPSFSKTKRTHYCGLPRKSDCRQQMVLKGWAHHRRDHGGVIFVDLRDRTGICQVVFNPTLLDEEAFKTAHGIRSEFVLAVEGELVAREEAMVNPKMVTGEVELMVKRFEILNVSEPPPFKLDEYGKVSDEVRMRYRYLDLRRTEMQNNIIKRHHFYQAVRNYLSSQGFLEIETPCLAKATPEGARDFLVPSRLNPGKFYALPQSPQIFKQILMVAGFDRYFQLARCFRDEDLRANRTLEFTQINIEASFIEPEDLFGVIEGMIQAIFKVVRDEDIPAPFPILTYEDAMLRYGSDKPDLRFGLEISDVTDCFAEGCQFKVFSSMIEEGGVIRALCVPGGGDKYSNTQLKPDGELSRHVEIFGARGLAWFRCAAGRKLESNIAKFFSEECLAKLADRLEANEGDLVLMVADLKPLTAAEAMGKLRLKIAKDLNLVDKSKFKLCWVVDFPLVMWNDKENRWDPAHHPFTSPCEEDLPLLDTDIGKVRSRAYDLAMNGEEIGGGSIRIHRQDVQSKVFTAIGITPEEAKEKFGFLLEALSYGAPPHGGIAFGIDRIMMLLMEEDGNRQVIPFPITQSGLDLMSGSPSKVSPEQLAEVFVASTVEKKRTEATNPGFTWLVSVANGNVGYSNKVNMHYAWPVRS